MDSEEDKRLRGIRFALAYDASPELMDKLAEQYPMTLEEAEELLKKFAGQFKNAAKFARRYGSVQTPAGFKREITPRAGNGIIQVDFARAERILAGRIDNRLICDRCGELGRVEADERGFYVTAGQAGQCCCQTRQYPTAEDAIAGWEKLQEDDKHE